ncbi:hypothetical protein BJ138DRAFT_1116014 [Hygrophoropsis aurantiaca]|uniref:Uncharacterized protein n=1 Tax=Hygrophoropsis aurantiaca TaxID=72124 RepID=A0ACB8A5B7_9AGAM|nr:hypothetical protein BJ138DRAFT_1116014 [Hygrophoropsis aurantiaca]
MELAFFITLFFAVISAAGVFGETHTIKFANQCGYGTPALVVGGKNVSTGEDYTTNQPFSGIAYLQTGPCLANGENCLLLETTLVNSVCEGCGSSTDMSLIPPHAFNVPTSFSYYGVCDGLGATCSDPTCPMAFFTPTDYQAQVSCQDDNDNLLIAFCANASDIVLGSMSSSASSTSMASILSSQLTSATSASSSSTLSEASPSTSSTSTSVFSSASSTSSFASTSVMSSALSASTKQCHKGTSGRDTAGKRAPGNRPSKKHRRHSSTHY